MSYFKRESWVYWLAFEICTEIDVSIQSSSFIALLSSVYGVWEDVIFKTGHTWKDLQAYFSY